MPLDPDRLPAPRRRRSLGATGTGASFATSTGDILEVAAYGPACSALRVGPNTRPDYGLVVGRTHAVHGRAAGARRVDVHRRRRRRSSSPRRRCAFACSGRARRCCGRSPTSTSAAGRGCRRSAASQRGGLWTAALALASGEPVYGLGEKFGPLNKRGQLIHSQVEDALGVNTGLAYKNTPFAWSPGTGSGAWGVFVHTPGIVHARRRAPGLVASLLRARRRRRGARPLPVRRRHAGRHPRRVHASSPAAPRRCRGGASGCGCRARTTRRRRKPSPSRRTLRAAAHSLRRADARRPRRVEGRDALRLRVGPRPLRGPARVARRDQGAPPEGLRLGVPVRVGPRPAVRRARVARLPADDRGGRSVRVRLGHGAGHEPVRQRADAAARKRHRRLHATRSVRVVARRARGSSSPTAST